ncbi:NnrU family protein [Pseudooceanicola sediminis]|uniref:NnrU family protein n=1 Tax=Pseudooceanicola sediminis TaxID=2211117 RepID=UPI001314177E|nr:NnrU family protein [Pseudooceanicola sediminis]
MALILIGLILWTWPHLSKEYTPGLRAGLPENAARPLVAVVALIAVVLMVIGYRTADGAQVYFPPAWGQHLNNLLMVIAVLMLGTAHSKSRLRGRLRHPMFLAVILWGIAHLLVRGDSASLLLWGGMIVWAVAGWLVTNARHPDYIPYAGGTLAGDIRLALITVVVFAVIVLIHGWLGPNPLPM